jgi:hypothetical protein
VPPFRHSERSEESQLKNMRSFGLRPQDDKKRLNDKHQKKGNLIRHSERSEESPFFFSNQKIKT